MGDWLPEASLSLGDHAVNLQKILHRQRLGDLGKELGMEHFITSIHIDRVRHLHDMTIRLDEKHKRHLILTGKNGAGKTSLLKAMKENMQGIFESKNLDSRERQNHMDSYCANDLGKGIQLTFHHDDDLMACYRNHEFIMAHYAADRLTKINISQGVENVMIQEVYDMDAYPVEELAKYMVHLKTQQSYANNEKDLNTVQLIEKWFDRFEAALRKLMNDDSITLKYDFKKYSFQILQDGRNPVGFTELSDGYSAAIFILADLVMRMDQNWLLKNAEPSSDMEGIVLIDEVETHLHLQLQRTILPFLTEMFPNIQFIVATHSPFIVNSLDDAVVFDLENKTLVNGGLSNYTYSGIVEGYFHADELSRMLREKFERFRHLVQKQSLTDDDYSEIMDLELYLDEIPDYLAMGIAAEYNKLKLEFEIREEAE